MGHHLIIPTLRLSDNGLEAWGEVLRGNYEGMVAKDPAPAYTPGRTLSWLKVKQRAFAGRLEASIRADTALLLLCLGIDDRLFRRRR